MARTSSLLTQYFLAAIDPTRGAAELSDARVHDLRQSFASLLVNEGRTLYEVQHLLGYTQIKATQRYAHLGQDMLSAAANTASNLLDHLFSTVAMPRHSKPLLQGTFHV